MLGLKLQSDVLADFETYGREAEPYLERKVIRGYVISVLLFCAGVGALFYSNLGLAAALFVLALHFDQQSNTHHLLLMMTKYQRAAIQTHNVPAVP